LHKNHLALFDTPSIEADLPLGVGKEWGSQRYRIEGVFGSIKIKVNSVFTFFEHPEVKVINPGATVIWKLEQADNSGLVSVGFFAKCGDACFMYLVLFGQAYRYATQQG